MKAVILCGGRGTRLREETEHKPKPMIELGGKPIIWHIMKMFAAHGITDFVLCLGYKGDVIKEYFLRYEAMSSDFTITLGRADQIEFHTPHSESGWRITLADTGPDAMTGARVKRVQRYVGNERFFLTYGDGVSDVDLDAVVRFHESHGQLGTVTGVRPPGRFGELAVEGDRVTSFSEKPPTAGGLINGGFFVFEPAFFDYLSSADDCILERAPLEQLSRDGRLQVYRHEGFWQCVDTFRDYELLNSLWNSGSPPWRVWHSA
ncbi:MAG: glucose-1-phosphate cytidylyltransferase [Polyangiaceae bacterium]|nr:glucose-1-phosphate cytidylyltransferase [Polyangiaceae bacterium]